MRTISARRDRLQPYQQGGLDALCGPYAVVNAMRLLAAPYHPLRHAACQDLFAELIRILAAQGGLRRVTDGCGRKVMRRLIRHGQKWLADAKGFAFTVTQPFSGEEKLDRQQLVPVLTAHLSQAGQVAIIGTPEHWTVASGLQEGRLALFDSDGRLFRHLGKRHDRGPAAKRISPRSTFLLAPASGPSRHIASS